jgi:dihydropteroate synthase
MGISRWRLADRTLELDRPLGVGIVNVTEDSFFEGARSGTPERAVADGLALVKAGFDLLDVGAVAARSGPPVSADEEAERLLPAVRGLAQTAPVPVSADTFSTPVAARALEAGAVAINDISGGADPTLFELAAASGCGLVLMHIEGPPRQDRAPRRYSDPVAHLRSWFSERIEAAAAHGVLEEQIALDPGLDFDLSVADDLEILRRLGELRDLGRPLFVSLSRKDFLGAVLAGSWEERAPAGEREWPTAAATTLAVAKGADLLRLHDPSALQALRIAAAISRSAQSARGAFSSHTVEKTPRTKAARASGRDG